MEALHQRPEPEPVLIAEVQVQPVPKTEDEEVPEYRCDYTAWIHVDNCLTAILSVNLSPFNVNRSAEVKDYWGNRLLTIIAKPEGLFAVSNVREVRIMNIGVNIRAINDPNTPEDFIVGDDVACVKLPQHKTLEMFFRVHRFANRATTSRTDSSAPATNYGHVMNHNADFVVIAQNHIRFNVHREVLMSRNARFARLMCRFNSSHLVFEDVPSEAMNDMLRFIYNREAPKHVTLVLLLKADEFGMTELRDYCIFEVARNAHPGNIMALLSMAASENLKLLVEMLVDRAATFTVNMCSNPAFLQFLTDNSELCNRYLKALYSQQGKEQYAAELHELLFAHRDLDSEPSEVMETANEA